jgi:hypothetical protein
MTSMCVEIFVRGFLNFSDVVKNIVVVQLALLISYYFALILISS